MLPLFICFSCKPDDKIAEIKVPCSELYEDIYTDTIFGTVFLDCNETPAEGYLIIAQEERVRNWNSYFETDSIFTDENGNFMYVWNTFCQDREFGFENFLEFYVKKDPGIIGDNFNTINISFPTNTNQNFTYVINDTVNLKIQFHFNQALTASDTLWYSRRLSFENNFIVGPLVDTVVTLAAYSANENIFTDNMSSQFLNWAIGYEDFTYWNSIFQPGTHQVEYFHQTCADEDLCSIVVQ